MVNISEERTIGKCEDSFMNDVKVSIIMTTYNCISFLRESIDSVTQQSIKDIELLCIDGNSTDGTVEYINERMATDKRIKLFMQEGKGIGAAKNTGIKRAIGEFITFLDADDYYIDKYALEKMYMCAKDKKAKICGAFRSVLGEDGRVYLEKLHRRDLATHPNGMWLNYEDRQYDYHFHSYIYENEMIKTLGARFANTSCYDDTHFFIRAMLAAKKFYVLPIEMYMYRGGSPYVWNSEKNKDALIAFIDQLKISSENHLVALHWLTVQRINYEYKDNFVRSVREGDIKILDLLIDANRAINVALIKSAEEMVFPPDYLNTMMHRSREEMPIRYSNDGNHVILEPIWESILACGDYLNKCQLTSQREINSLRDKLEDDNRVIEHILNSYSYRIGRIITWLPRMLRRKVKLLHS